MLNALVDQTAQWFAGTLLWVVSEPKSNLIFAVLAYLRLSFLGYFQIYFTTHKNRKSFNICIGCGADHGDRGRVAIGVRLDVWGTWGTPPPMPPPPPPITQAATTQTEVVRLLLAERRHRRRIPPGHVLSALLHPITSALPQRALACPRLSPRVSPRRTRAVYLPLIGPIPLSAPAPMCPRPCARARARARQPTPPPPSRGRQRNLAAAGGGRRRRAW